MDNLDWQPGEEGKGLVDEHGHIHTWNPDVEYNTHDDYIKNHPHVGSPHGYFQIEPNGKFDVINPSYGYDRAGWQLMNDYIKDVIPELHPAEPDSWSFG